MPSTPPGAAPPTPRRVPRPPAEDPLTAFTEAEIAACAAYARPRRRWGFAALGFDLLLLAGLALTPPGRTVVRALGAPFTEWAPGRAVLVTAGVAALQALAGLPFNLRTWRQDVRAGLSTQDLPAWLADWAKARAVGVVLTTAGVAGLILAARGLPGHPLTTAAGAAALVVVLSLAGPVVLEPLFNRFTPMEPGPVRDAVLATAARMRVPVAEVLVADASRRTTRVNAYVSGLGRTRRVVVYDTLAGRAAPGELLLVLAHELAHVRHRDVAWGTAGMAAAAGLGVIAADLALGTDAVRSLFDLGGLGDPLAAPALLLLGAVTGLLLAPAGSGISRWSEARADWAALEARRDPESAAAVERRLALDNRADLRPNPLLTFWFASHPPVMARIAQARLWAGRQDATSAPDGRNRHDHQ